MPESSDSTSIVTLSLSTENNGSPACTCSPALFSQLPNVPSSIDQPSRGIVIWMAIGYSLIRSRTASTIASALTATAASSVGL